MNIEKCIPEQPCSIPNVTRSAFLHAKFPVLPYCEFHRGPSTNYHESFYVENRAKGLQLYFSWTSDDRVSIGIYNVNETNPYKKTMAIRVDVDEFSNELINTVCKRFLVNA